MEAQFVPARIIEWTVDPPAPTYEIIVREGSTNRVKVSLWIFRSWSGRRFLNGTEYHGPVYYLGTDEVYEKK